MSTAPGVHPETAAGPELASQPAEVRAGLRKTVQGLLPALPALVFLSLFFAVPVLQILRDGFYSSEGALGLDQFQRIASNPVYAKVLATTFIISGLTAILSVLLGYPVAYLLSQMSANSRSRWVVWLLVPFWTSYLVKTFAWILVLSRTGVLASFATVLGFSAPGSLVPSRTAVLIGMVHGLLPLAVLTMLPSMRDIDVRLLRAAESLGASRAVSFFSVFLPLSAPGAAAAGLLVFITSLGFFIVPSLLGTPHETMIAQLVISSVLELLDLHFAGALSAVLLICAVTVFIIYDRVAGLSSLSGETTATPRGRGLGWLATMLVAVGIWVGRLVDIVPAAIKRGRGVKIYTVAIILLLSLPIAVVLPIAFTKAPFLAFPPQGFSLKWFHTFLESPIWQIAWLRSIGVATTTALAALVMGLGVALSLARLPARWTKPVFAFSIAPLIVPRIVLAVGLFYLYAHLGLSGTNLGLVIGHTILAIPYVVVTLAAAFKHFDWRLDDAAKILGASWFGRLRTVMLPLLMPSLVAAFMFAFITSFDELTIALFVSGGLKTTLPKQMWDDMQLQLNPTLAAVAATLTAAIVLLVLIPTFFRRAD